MVGRLLSRPKILQLTSELLLFRSQFFYCDKEPVLRYRVNPLNRNRKSPPELIREGMDIYWLIYGSVSGSGFRIFCQVRPADEVLRIIRFEIIENELIVDIEVVFFQIVGHALFGNCGIA